jgi:microcystin-dependent protein
MFIGEIRLVSFDFAPRYWAHCNGQMLAIQQNQALFSLLGVTYGGNGVTQFALPNLQGRLPMHRSTSHPQGESAGQTQVTLTASQLPVHSHLVQASNAAPSGASKDPGGRSLASATALAYVSGPATIPATPASSNTGESQPHSTMQPFLALRFVIALNGIWPQRP